MRLDHLLSRVKKTYQKGEAEGFRERGKGNRKHYMVLKVLGSIFRKKSLQGTQGKLRGGVAQLGERLPCKQEAIGSNPFISTIRGLIAQMVRARA